MISVQYTRMNSFDNCNWVKHLLDDSFQNKRQIAHFWCVGQLFISNIMPVIEGRKKLELFDVKELKSGQSCRCQRSVSLFTFECGSRGEWDAQKTKVAAPVCNTLRRSRRRRSRSFSFVVLGGCGMLFSITLAIFQPFFVSHSARTHTIFSPPTRKCTCARHCDFTSADRPTGAASFEVKSSVRAALSSLARAARRPPICPVDRPCRFNICIPPRADVQLTRAAALFFLCGSSSLDWTLHLRRFSYWNARSRGCMRRLSLMLRKVTRVIYLFIITFIVSWVNMIHLETPLRALCRDFLYSIKEIN